MNNTIIEPTSPMTESSAQPALATKSAKITRITYLVLLALALTAPMLGLYPVFVMKLLCFALFACAFNLLLGFTGLLSFGHAAFLALRPTSPAGLSSRKTGRLSWRFWLAPSVPG